jgi:hypothetical protein
MMTLSKPISIETRTREETTKEIQVPMKNFTPPQNQTAKFNSYLELSMEVKDQALKEFVKPKIKSMKMDGDDVSLNLMVLFFLP